MNQGKLREAEAIYKELISEGTNNPITYGNLAKICGMQSRFDELKELIKKALELNPSYPEAHNYLGNSLRQQGDIGGAIKAYNNAIQLNPNYAKAHNNLGIALMQQGDPTAAIDSFFTVIQLKHNLPEAHNDLGIALMQQGNLIAAIDSFITVIQLKPNFPEAHNNLGLALQAQGNLTAATDSFNTAIQLKPTFFEAHYNLGNALNQQDDVAAAIASYNTALRLKPNHPEAHNNLGIALQEQGNLAAAIDSFNTAIKLKHNFPDSHNNLGNALRQLDDVVAAIASYNTALRLNPNYPEAHNNLGLALQEQGNLAAAIDSFNAAIQLKPNFPDAHNNLGNALRQVNDVAAAISSYNTALKLKPNYPEAHYNLGITFQEQGNLAAAIDSYKTAIQLKPSFPDAHNNLGAVLQDQRDLTAAITSYKTTIRLKPNYPEAHNNLGLALQEQGDLTGAINSYKIALQLKPHFPEVHNNLGNALQELGDLTAAIGSFNTALQLNPDYPFVVGSMTHLLCNNCEWSELAPLVSQITQAVCADEPITPPFALLALVDDLRLHRQAAATWVRELKTPSSSLRPLAAKPRGERIHIAYLSADFHNHATSYLMAELFELHDRDRFELTAISFGPAQESTMRQRLAMAFDRFEEVNNTSDIEVARMCREIGVDLAVDLKGFTQNCRAGILAHRCAPIQINWLGYPGTMAAPFIDYIVADHTLVSKDDLNDYSEKLIWLPDSYQVNDGKRVISDKTFTRAECGLPEMGFVFCCFNNNYKILPHTFDVWMQILKRVPDSILWLLEGNPTAAANLRREALARGIAPERLVFAKRMPLAEHLARHRLANLFIDSWPYNAHTTASDALWSGLPVLTRAGRSFASRVAASLLQAIGMPELITRSDQHYEDLAVALAQDRARLQALQQKLAANRLNQPLFNCERFTRNLESAFEQVMERYWAGAEPDHLAIVPAAAATQPSNLPVEKHSTPQRSR
jgi:predicted O-linked N-acetylglucosamine transferase (SPINDLY family)